MQNTLLILGAGGYIGMSVVREAVAAGWLVTALVRTDHAASALLKLGAQPIIGDASNPADWLDAARRAKVLLDLVQPRLPKRLTRCAIQKASRYRLELTQNVIDGLKALPEAQRPLLFSVSGVDDLQADGNNTISHQSGITQTLRGFAPIGVPVRRLIEKSGVGTIHVYLGTVYGPGKGFAERIVPGLAKHTMPIIGSGSNRLTLIHVDDAARAMIHLAGQLEQTQPGCNWVITDGTAPTQADFLNGIASLINAKPPARVPYWLAAILAGSALVETMTRDRLNDVSALQATGFTWRYPDWQHGVPHMLKALGYSVPNPLNEQEASC